jgi:hypothetical protein
MTALRKHTRFIAALPKSQILPPVNVIRPAIRTTRKIAFAAEYVRSYLRIALLMIGRPAM